MKKVLSIVAVVACVAALFSSCDKKCTCKTYLDGKVTTEVNYTISKDSDKKCSDYATTAIVEDANGKTGVECK